MKKDYIAEVEVVDVGEHTLFDRCPAEFSGRIIEEDDRVSRYGFVEKITVYEEDGSESTYFNQIKIYPRNYIGDPRDDFLVVVTGSDVWNKELKCRYNDIIAKLEEKGLKFKLELFLADLLKVDTVLIVKSILLKILRVHLISLTKFTCFLKTKVVLKLPSQ